MSQDLSSHLYDGVSRRNLFWTDLYALKDGIATPYPLLTIQIVEDFLNSTIPGISEKAISFCQHSGAQELRIPYESRASSKADSTEDALNVGINLLPFFLPTKAYPERIFNPTRMRSNGPVNRMK